MNTILQKDLRENFKLALIGLIIFSLFLIVAYQNSLQSLDTFLGNTNGTSIGELCPLTSTSAMSFTAIFCAIYGALLGWLQTRNEAHRDLWAFLVHRPVTRTQIFQGKVCAGLVLYAVGAGAPLAVLMILCVLPGHFPVPFEWAMLLPLTASFLAGLTYYFAGTLTGLRQARWYASRCFGFGGALIASFLMFKVVEFGHVLLDLVIITGVLATAVWGAYQSGGYYRGQPRAGKTALSLSMAAGSSIVLVVVVALLSALVFEHLIKNASPDPQYAMLTNGEIAREIWQGGEWEMVEDLQGKPLLDPQTGNRVDSRQSDHLRANGAFISADLYWNSYYGNYRQSRRFFSLWNVMNKKLWYIDRHGRLLGYDGITKKFIGEIRAADSSGATDMGIFKTPDQNYGQDYFYRDANTDQPKVLITSNAVYQVDLAMPSIKRIFTAAAGDPLTGYNDRWNSSNVVIATHKTIQVINFTGSIEFKTAYSPSIEDRPTFQLYQLDNGQKAIWFSPNYYLSPEHVAWIGTDGKIIKSRELPSLYKPYKETLWNKFLSSLMPPGVLLYGSVVFFYDWARFYQNITGFPFLSGCVLSALCVLIGWVVMTRYHFSAGAKGRWSVFIFLLGIPGLLALVVTEEWPVREACPQCRRLRSVERVNCEYCDAEFPVAEKNGTEIFEPLSAVSK